MASSPHPRNLWSSFSSPPFFIIPFDFSNYAALGFYVLKPIGRLRHAPRQENSSGLQVSRLCDHCSLSLLHCFDLRRPESRKRREAGDAASTSLAAAMPPPSPLFVGLGTSFPAILGDALDPFNPRRSLIDAVNLVNQMLDFPFGAGWRGWDAREDDKALYLKVEMPGLGKDDKALYLKVEMPGLGKDDKALYLKVEMPGLGKDDVQVKVENNTLVIKGEAPKEGVECGEGEQGGDEGRERGRRRYSSRIELPKNQYDLERIRAEMKNGVLRAVVPKVKMEERKNVRDILIE